MLTLTGQSGLGKSTLINTLFASHLINSKGRSDNEGPIRQTTEINQQSHVIVENGVKLKLNIIDTPGYGDQINNEGCWEPIIKHVGLCSMSVLRAKDTGLGVGGDFRRDK